MARRLSKKKISGWLLLFVVIIFIKCGGWEKTTSMVKGIVAEVEKAKLLEEPQDIPIDTALVSRLDSFVQRTPRLGSLGIYVWDETAHKPVYAYNPDTLMRPASNMKMLTCIAALRRLGPNYKFESGVYSRGTMKNGTLLGDLAFKFTFDPFLNSDSVAVLARAVSEKGIARVKGRIIVDLAVREPMMHEEHWTIGDLKMRKLCLIPEKVNTKV